MAIYYGKTVQEAIESGLKEEGITENEAEIKVLEEPTKGFLGINAKKAKVEIGKKRSDGERAVDFLDGLFDLMKVTAKCVLEEEDERVVINLIADRSSSLIGYRGEVLDALQCLAGAVANTGREEYRRVVVDCEEYREKREETLISLANKLAAKAVRTGRKVTLEPMNPYERRILHSALADSQDVKTQSEGKEPNRYVAIIPNNMKPYTPRYNNNGGRNFGGKRKYGEDEGNNGYRGYNNRGGYRKYNNADEEKTTDGEQDENGYRREGGYNRNNYGATRVYNRDGYKKDYNREGGYNRNNGGFKKYDRDAAPRQPRPKTSGFGTFLGNSLKDAPKAKETPVTEETNTEE